MKTITNTKLHALAGCMFACFNIGLLISASPAFGQGTWVGTGPMNTGRFSFTATLLSNGKVLVAGGSDSNYPNISASAELYDPATGIWTPTGSMNTPRAIHTAILLPNGKVLVAGGWSNSYSTVLSSAELYDPATGTWTPTGSMTSARVYYTTTLLSNGKVLAAGGTNGPTYVSSAELYDPAIGMWTATGSMTTARNTHFATLLPNGKVLVAGGETTFGTPFSSAELYDPIAGTWVATGSMTTGHDTGGSTIPATVLPNGKVLIVGGYDGIYISTADLYDPTTGTWTATGSMNEGREVFTESLLANGQVLVAGGFGNAGFLSSAELYDPAIGTWAATGSLNTARIQHAAALLPNGQVLAMGGYNVTTSNALSSAELYQPPLVYSAMIQQPINSDGSSVFNVRRGVIPVKFTLSLNGVPTCQLPPATIALTRTAGGVPGPIDELVYIGPADTGSNFRIDSCQYIYNLSASALGVGTYRVDIKINNQIVGSAVFQLR